MTSTPALQADTDEQTPTRPACVLVFNANDPSGAGGLAADVTSIASIGAHALPVVTGTYVRDSAQIFGHFCLDEEMVTEQARACLEDVSVQVIKVGFVGSPDNLGTIASIASDYEDVPVITYMPSLAWWDEQKIDDYQEALRELLLPHTTVLVGNHSTLWRWLLPDWDSERSPTARELARAAGECGVSYTLVTGLSLHDQLLDNVLASAQSVLKSEHFERFDAIFSGAGDTLSAALAAVLASGSELTDACSEALTYLDRCLDGGFQPGMGHALPDRLFWAQAEPATEDGAFPTQLSGALSHGPRN